MAAIAEFDASLLDAMAELASALAAAAELSAVFAAFCLLQAAMETAEIAAPTIRRVRSVPEVICPGPIG